MYQVLTLAGKPDLLEAFFGFDMDAFPTWRISPSSFSRIRAGHPQVKHVRTKGLMALYVGTPGKAISHAGKV